MANPMDRRGFLATGTLLGAASALGLTTARAATPADPWPPGTGPILTGKAPADAQVRSGGMPLARYLQYVNLFNNDDPRFIEFYHPNVELELGNATIKTATGIRDFYMQYFQAPGVAEAEFERDIAATLRRIYYSGSGDAPPPGPGSNNACAAIIVRPGAAASQPAGSSCAAVSAKAPSAVPSAMKV